MACRGTTAEIDLIELEKLSAMQCTDEELANWFRVTTRTIERRRKVRAFSEAIARGRAKGKISIRRAQLKMLEEGNATMGIWLGKQYLGQTDSIDVRSTVQNVIVVMPHEKGLASDTGDEPIIEAEILSPHVPQLR